MTMKLEDHVWEGQGKSGHLHQYKWVKEAIGLKQLL